MAPPTPIAFAYDYNRDSLVDGFDMAIARDNPTNFTSALKLLVLPAATSAGLAGAPLAAGAEGEAFPLLNFAVGPASSHLVGASLVTAYPAQVLAVLPVTSAALPVTPQAIAPRAARREDIWAAWDGAASEALEPVLSDIGIDVARGWAG
ncbi:MAG: hypothetical protein NTY19_07630 [Planctomycetota bacterium]|nr:hypothetical protein [Planctomycetota bacterium]